MFLVDLSTVACYRLFLLIHTIFHLIETPGSFPSNAWLRLVFVGNPMQFLLQALALAIVNKALKQSWKFGCEQTVPEMRREIESLCRGSKNGSGNGSQDSKSWWGQWRAKHGLHDTKVCVSVVVCVGCAARVSASSVERLVFMYLKVLWDILRIILNRRKIVAPF